MTQVDFKKLSRELSDKNGQTSSVLMLSVFALILIFLVWASITEIDNVTRGDGKLISPDQNQLVQSSEPGVIVKRYVTEGDMINKGQLLFDIDPVDAKTQLDQVNKRQAGLRLQAIRLTAEINRINPKFPDELVTSAPDVAKTELALFEARLKNLETKTEILLQRRAQKENEIEELIIQEDTANKSVDLINQEIDNVEPLVKRGLAPETRLIGLERDRTSALGAISTAQNAKIKVKSALREIDGQLKSEEENYTTEALANLSKIETELGELNARIPALQERVIRTSVKSPVDGIVNRVSFVTDGAYVAKGDVLLEIVPTGLDLIAEAKIDPKDIPDLFIDQQVKISLSAFDPMRYGRIDGRVIKVSADAITDPGTNAQYYEVDISVDSMLYEDNGAAVTLLPGMTLSVDVLGGKRTILQYFWAPISRTKERALRD